MQFDLLGYIHENMEYSENHDSYMVWKKDRRAGSNGKGRLNAKAGDSVGCLNSSGYFTTRINKNVCGVHRLVWMFHNGDIPCGMVIDHIDGDITNNNIANLRVVTRKHNSQNCKKAKNNTNVDNKKRVCDNSFIKSTNTGSNEMNAANWKDRAEAAESELLAVREDNHSMMLEIDGMRTELTKLAQQKPFGRFVKIIDPIDKNKHTYGVDYYSGFYVADLLDKEVYAAPVAPPAATAPSVLDILNALSDVLFESARPDVPAAGVLLVVVI